MKPRQVIWKQELPIEDEVVITLPFMADVLHVGVQQSNAYSTREPAEYFREKLMIWFLCDPDERPSRRRFHIVGTGNPVPPEVGVHVGTVQMPSGLVWHVFDSVGEVGPK